LQRVLHHPLRLQCMIHDVSSGPAPPADPPCAPRRPPGCESCAVVRRPSR
jgi:hypothetical protein